MNPDPHASSPPHGALRWPGVRFRQNADGAVEASETAFHEFVGRNPQSGGLNFWELVHPKDRAQLRARMAEMNAASPEMISRFRIRRLDTGRIVHLLERRRCLGNAVGFPASCECEWLDVTREVLAEQRLTSAAWTGTFNHLLRGLAHDLANFVAGAQAFLEACHARLAQEHPLRETATLVRQRAEHAVEVLRRVGELNRQQPGARGWADVRSVVAEIQEIAACLFPKRLRVEPDLPPEPIEAEFDAVALRRALLALVVETAQSTRRPVTVELLARRCECLEEARSLGMAEGTLPVLCVRIRRLTSAHPAMHPVSVGSEGQTTSKPFPVASAGLLCARMFALAHQGDVAELSTSGADPGVCLWWPALAPKAADRKDAPCVLVCGRDSVLTQDLVAEFRGAGFRAALAGGVDEFVSLLDSPEYEFDGAVLHTDASCPVDEAVVRALNSPGHRALKVALVNETGIFDALSPRLSNRADLRVRRGGVVQAFTTALK